MNRDQFKDPIPHMCLVGIVVAVQILLMMSIFVNEFPKFSEKHLGKNTISRDGNRLEI